jgi:predicted nucleic acid-binding protein
MKASPSARSWIAAGVRHELLTRALPALRHDMAAPVSVIRMALLMLKRQVGAATIDATACEERVALIDNQVSELIEAIRSLRDWELATTDDGITRSALVAQCVALMRSAFDLHGVALDADASLDPQEDEHRWPAAAALRYLFLGALGYLHDGAAEAGAIRVEADGANALRLTALPREPGGTPAVLDAHRAPRALAIDAVALQNLAEDLGYAVALDGDSVRLVLATGN